MTCGSGCPSGWSGWPTTGTFAGPTDPRFLSTLDRISEQLASDSLVHRYAITGHDGLTGGEGTFNLCSFWYVEALTRAGRLREARMVFEKMLTRSASSRKGRPWTITDSSQSFSER